MPKPDDWITCHSCGNDLLEFEAHTITVFIKRPAAREHNGFRVEAVCEDCVERLLSTVATDDPRWKPLAAVLGAPCPPH